MCELTSNFDLVTYIDIHLNLAESDMFLVHRLWFLFALFAQAYSEYAEVKKIGVQIGDEGCNCNMKVTICGGPDGLCCQTPHLNTEHDDFNHNDYNLFEGPQIGECLNFPIKKHHATTVFVEHNGLDAVSILYWDIIYSDEVTERCDDNHEYDNEDSKVVYCGKTLLIE